LCDAAMAEGEAFELALHQELPFNFKRHIPE
jgi:hypothetical protein